MVGDERALDRAHERDVTAYRCRVLEGFEPELAAVVAVREQGIALRDGVENARTPGSIRNRQSRRHERVDEDLDEVDRRVREFLSQPRSSTIVD